MASHSETKPMVRFSVRYVVIYKIIFEVYIVPLDNNVSENFLTTEIKERWISS